MLTGKAFTKTTGGGIGSSYYYAGGKRVAMRVRNADFSTNLYYLLSDHLGSTSVTADSQGNALANMGYMPWGEARFNHSNLNTDYRYTGQKWAGMIGLYYYKARWSRSTPVGSMIPC
jgi:hypothetical protein